MTIRPPPSSGTPNQTDCSHRYRTVRRSRKPVGDSIGMFRNGDISRRSRIPRDQAVRSAHQRRLQHLVVIGIPAPEFRAGDRNPLGDGFELGQVDSPPFPADITIELREKQPRSQLVERLVGEQQHAALLTHGVDGCAWTSIPAKRRTDQDIGVQNDTLSFHPPVALRAGPWSSLSRTLPRPGCP